MTGGITSSKKLKAAERRLLALGLRKQGFSLRDIADELARQGVAVSLGTVHNDLKQALSQVAEEMLDQARSVLALELLRLDEMQAAYWLAAVGGKVMVRNEDGYPEERQVIPDPKRAALILDIMERRAKLLGLDKMDLRVGDPQGQPLGSKGSMATVPEGDLDHLLSNLLAAVGASTAVLRGESTPTHDPH